MLVARKAKAAGRLKSVGLAIDRQRSVPHQVYDVLREKILTLELKPGESINERWLADWLGVSRTPIREAINRLAANGLIAITPNVGTYVSLINVGRVEEFNLIRTNLETMIVRVAAERFDDKADALLCDLIDRHIDTLIGPRLLEHIVVDTEFHRAIARASGLTATWNILQHVMDEILRVRHMWNRLPHPLRDPIDEHLAILEALRTRRAETCERAMKAHLDASHRRLVEALAEHPEYLEN